MAEAELTYIRNAANHPVGAVAIQRVGEGTIRLAVSKCHEMDKFDKKVARNRALGRLNSSRFAKEFTVGSPDIATFLTETYRLDEEQVSKAQVFINIHSTPKMATKSR